MMVQSTETSVSTTFISTRSVNKFRFAIDDIGGHDDAHSTWIEAEATHASTARTTVQALRKMFATKLYQTMDHASPVSCADSL